MIEASVQVMDAVTTTIRELEWHVSDACLFFGVALPFLVVIAVGPLEFYQAYSVRDHRNACYEYWSTKYLYSFLVLVLYMHT